MNTWDKIIKIKKDGKVIGMVEHDTEAQVKRIYQCTEADMDWILENMGGKEVMWNGE